MGRTIEFRRITYKQDVMPPRYGRKKTPVTNLDLHILLFLSRPKVAHRATTNAVGPTEDSLVMPADLRPCRRKHEAHKHGNTLV